MQFEKAVSSSSVLDAQVDKMVKTSSGIMGNVSYTWVGAEYKTEVLAILESAVQQVK